jgi:hypothetical protein
MNTPSSNPLGNLHPEVRERLTAWLYDDVQQDEEDGLHQRHIQVRNFLNQPHLHWPDSVDVNSSSDAGYHLTEFSQVFSRTAPRCLFITTDGHLGAGPGCARAGDKVFLPLGCSVPLVIRPSGPRFEVVADAFVGGIMQGELFSGRDVDLDNLTDVVLQ